MGIKVDSLLWAMQNLYHQPYTLTPKAMHKTLNFFPRYPTNRDPNPRQGPGALNPKTLNSKVPKLQSPES